MSDLIPDQDTSQIAEDEEVLSDPEAMYDEPEEAQPQAVEAVAEIPETPEETVEETPQIPAFEYIPTIAQNLLNEQEQAWADENIAPELQNYFLALAERIAGRHAAASAAATAQTAKLNPEYMAVYGPAVIDALNQIPAAQRGTPEAVDQAVTAALWQRSKQIGMLAAMEESARLMRGGSSTPQTPAQKPIIPANQRSVTPTVQVAAIPSTRSNGRTGTARVLAGLGIKDD